MVLDTLTDWLTAIQNSDLKVNLKPKRDGIELRVFHSSGSDLIYEFSPLESSIKPFSLNVRKGSSYFFVLRFYSHYNITGDEYVDIPIVWLDWFRKGEKITFRCSRLPCFRVDKKKILLITPHQSRLDDVASMVGSLPRVPPSKDLSLWLPTVASQVLGIDRRLRSSLTGSWVKSGFNSPPAIPRMNPSVSTRLSQNVSFTTDLPTGITHKDVFPDEVVTDFFRSYSSVSTPNFHRLKKSQLPINNYSLAVQITDDRISHDKVEASNFTVDSFSGNSIGKHFTPLSASFSPTLRSRAIAKVIERGNKNIDGNIAQDIAQFYQLNRLIGGTTHTLGNAIELIRSKNIFAAAVLLTKSESVRRRIINEPSKLKSVAQFWLQIQYAWKPLLQDINALMQLIAQWIVGEPVIVRVSAMTNEDRGLQFINHEPLIAGGKKPEIAYYQRRQCKVVLRYTYANRYLSFVQRMGFTNGLNLAYEVLPFSFVADWFLPIGPYLESLTAFQGLALKDGRITQFCELNQACSFADRVGPQFGTYYSVNAGYARRTILVNREKLTSFPFLSPPRFKNGFSITHSLNGLALITNAVYKKP